MVHVSARGFRYLEMSRTRMDEFLNVTEQPGLHPTLPIARLGTLKVRPFYNNLLSQ